ncbi:hypothetical protein [uncultured Gimesia sp.]|uniref:hypothetical protein n=1 Tax=uncultured Gimesia sp. TaxID=1678688 RepID=UPI00262C62C0|nr:hypothetical protein [uncultured Gimesia sp.]
MSDDSLKQRIFDSLNQFALGELDLESLIDSIKLNASALEKMPYALIQEMDDVESHLTMARDLEEEGCEMETEIEELILVLQSCLK